MGPLLSGSGNRVISQLSWEYRLDFNGAASQWKRKSYNIESERKETVKDFNGAASQWKRKSIKQGSKVSSARRLQWGRFSVEAEIFVISLSAPQSFSNFNGAASQWKRKYNGWIFYLNRWKRTSMGPLLSGSGNFVHEVVFSKTKEQLQWGRFSVEAEIQEPEIEGK